MSRAIFGLALVLLAGPARATCWGGDVFGADHCQRRYETERWQQQQEIKRQREAIQQLQRQQQGGSVFGLPPAPTFSF